MPLKDNIDYAAFLKQVRLCRGDVHYTTVDGDFLNLKSILSEYIFMSVAMSSDMIKGGSITCVSESDYELIENFLLQF